MNRVAPSLLSAYQETDYVVNNNQLETIMRVGEQNSVVAHWLSDSKLKYAGFITAFNPDSIMLSDAENQQRHQQLISIVEHKNLQFIEGFGKGRDNKWPAETSLLISANSKHTLNKLAAKFGQAAFVLVDARGFVELIDKSQY